MAGTRIPAVSPETSKTGAQTPLADKSVLAGFEAKHSVSLSQSTAPESILARELFRETAAALGFPRDQLSVALLAFARFFSLSPALLGVLRKDFLSSLKDLPRDTKHTQSQAAGHGHPVSGGKTGFEEGAMAVAAALDKGVALCPDALAYYARFLVPPDAPDGHRTGGESFSHGAGDEEDRDEDNDLEEPPEIEKLQAIAENEVRKDNLLDILNSLPGKNGQRWAVFPFSIKVRGIELKVFIRILKRASLLHGEGDLVIADISGPKRQWRCILRERNGKILADLQIYPQVSARTLNSLKRAAEHFLKEATDRSLKFGDFGEILVRNRDMSWMEDLCAESLLSVNKEV